MSTQSVAERQPCAFWHIVRDWIIDRRMSIMFVLVSALVASFILRGHRPLELGRWRTVGATVGLAMIALGLGLRSWAAAQLHKGEVLATEGPYELCRNPLYLGSLLMVSGFCTLIADPLTAAALAVGFGVTIGPTIRQEEGKLGRRFGDVWVAYVRQVPTFVPRRLPRTLGPISATTWRGNREYNALLATGLGLLAILAWFAR